MAYFDPQRTTRLKTDAGLNGIAATLKKYNPFVRRSRPVPYRSRALTDAEQLEKKAKVLETRTDHKPLVPSLLSGCQTTASLRIESMRVRLQGFNFHLNYIPGRSAGMERTDADCNSRHPQLTIATKHRTETEEVVEELSGRHDEFEKGIVAVVQELGREAVTMHELQENTELEPELSELKMVIARG